MSSSAKPTALEFFAGGGLARLGFGEEFETIWANDFDTGKAAAWQANFGAQGFVMGDIHAVSGDDVPKADLAWASFPCQDLSLAGERGGLSAKRSGAFHSMMSIIAQMRALGRAPRVLVLENVTGLLTSRAGADFAVVLHALAQNGYRAGALAIDARDFLPQSRPRVFIVAVAEDVTIPLACIKNSPSPFITPAIARAYATLPLDLTESLIAWHLPRPPHRHVSLNDIFDDTDQNWWPHAKANKLINALSDRHRATLSAIQARRELELATVFRRTRTRSGIKSTYAEMRGDGIAGCLRTPSGGSSRQFWVRIEGQRLEVRAINAREAMRLMGVPDNYIFPKSQLAGLKIAGDGVAVPVVAWLSAHLLAPLSRS